MCEIIETVVVKFEMFYIFIKRASLICVCVCLQLQEDEPGTRSTSRAGSGEFVLQ